jgi:tRNA threonylcarbamoyladenosine biosynthesis protein TsaB
MILLALETTADLCSIAVSDEAGLLVERAFRHRMHLSERLIDDVDAVLRDAGTSLARVEGFGVGIGPGSFTGVRVGVMAVKTWAATLKKPVVGVNALEAAGAPFAGAAPGLIASVIRARPGAVYLGLYRNQGVNLMPVEEPRMLLLSELGDALAAHRSEVLFCGEGLRQMRGEIVAACGAAGVSARFAEPEPPRAATVCRIARERLLSGLAEDPHALVPLYIAPPPIGPPAGAPKKVSP